MYPVNNLNLGHRSYLPNRGDRCWPLCLPNVHRAFDHIFETIQTSDEIRYLVHASYLEIYNEDVRDLLGKDPKQKLELKEHPEKGVYIQGRCRGSTSRVGVGAQHPG